MLGAFCVLCLCCAPATAQTTDYSGTWKLSRDASRIATGVGISGLGAGGAPPTLYISQAANGTVVVGSDINESHARTYRAGSSALSSETGGVREALIMSADGQTLTVTVTAVPASGSGSADVTTTLVYRKVQREDPCEQWPTPCRYGGRR